MNNLSEFRTAALAAFDFLLRDCGFILERAAEERDESFLVYRRGDVLVTVNWALGDEPWVVLNFVSEGRELSLKKLAKERGIAMPAPSEPSVRAMLRRDAEVLRAWCDGEQRDARLVTD